MIWDVLETNRQALLDSTTGLNAEITNVNTAKASKLTTAGVKAAPQVNEFLTWSQAKLPTEMLLPTALLVWEDSFNMEMASQGKWRGDHRIAWQYFTEERDGGQARSDLALVAHAMRTVSDTLVGQDTIQQIQERVFTVAGWKMSGRLFTSLTYSFVVKERDENP